MKKTGFTLVEVLLALFIFALILTIGFFVSNGASYLSDIVRTQTDVIVAALRKARVQSITGQPGAPYSVRFSTNSITILPSNEMVTLDGVQLSPIQLGDSGNTVTFATGLGTASPTGQVVIQGFRTDIPTRTITISSSGIVDWKIP